ncbi:MAG: hypothetical protein HZB77_10780 [Chloroflexi bacterium]|nr:hypothetical protein [Chloroflexota bacterium]
MVANQARLLKFVDGEFFTSVYRITGRVSFSGLGLVNVLSDSTRSAMMIENAYLSHITHPSVIISHRASVHVPKTSLDLMVFGKSDNIGLEAIRSLATRVTRHKVFMATNTFEILGLLDAASGKFDPEIFLTNVVSAYLPILSVTASAYFLPKAIYSGEIAFVNRAHINLITAED